MEFYRWRGPLLWRAFFTTAVVAVILRTGVAWCKQGHCGLAGEGGLIIFDVSGVQDNYGLNELVPVIVLGLLGGVFGSLFNQINARIIMWSGGWLKKYDSLTIILYMFMSQKPTLCDAYK